MVIAYLKGLFPGVLASWLVGEIMGGQGARGGLLGIHHETVANFEFFWSWPVFWLVTLLAGTLLWMTDN